MSLSEIHAWKLSNPRDRNDEGIPSTAMQYELALKYNLNKEEKVALIKVCRPYCNESTPY